MALSCFYCDTLVDKLRQQTTSESDKLALGAVANEVYTDGVRRLFLWASILEQEKIFEQAFYFAEKSKSSVLLKLFRFRSQIFAGIPPTLLGREKITYSRYCHYVHKSWPNTFSSEEKNTKRTSFGLIEL